VVIVTVPDDTPVTTPVLDTVAVPRALLLHVVPVVVVLNVVVLPTHTLSTPVIAPGNGFTVSGAVALQPLGASMYDIVATDGTATDPPVTIPVPIPIVAVVVGLLNHVPVPGVLPSVTVAPSQIPPAGIPVIAVGVWFTVSTAVVVQPVPNE
jgi:hypothetical protein